MDTLWRDVRFGLRLHLKSPGFLAVVVLALALGIGANTAVFSVVYSVLLRPPPYPAPDRLMMIFDTQPDCAICPGSCPRYIDWRSENSVLEVIGGSVPAGAVLTGLREPERIAPGRSRGLRGSQAYSPRSVSAASSPTR